MKKFCKKCGNKIAIKWAPEDQEMALELSDVITTNIAARITDSSGAIITNVRMNLHSMLMYDRSFGDDNIDFNTGPQNHIYIYVGKSLKINQVSLSGYSRHIDDQPQRDELILAGYIAANPEEIEAILREEIYESEESRELKILFTKYKEE